MSAPLPINSRIVIPADELETSFVRSSGPGGQNVNKVNTKAVLRWNPVDSAALPAAVKQRLLDKCDARLTRDGHLILASDVHRTQARNLAECREKIRQLVLSVLAPPVKRRPTKPTRGAQERRLRAKKHRSQRKTDRKFPSDP